MSYSKQMPGQGNKHNQGGSSNHKGGNMDRNKGKHARPHQKQEQPVVDESLPSDVGGEDNPVQQKVEKKFSGRCRLFVGNLTNDTDEEEFKKMFKKYGDVSEVYLNKERGFGFIRLDTRLNAEMAKSELDGSTRRGRVLRVRFATHGAALRIRNLHPVVSNELLEQAFSQFGVIERAVVIVDDRGRPTGDGIVEFSRKPGAQNALKRCKEGCFVLTTTPKPIIVEPLDQKDEEDGLPEKNVQKNATYHKEREGIPRFAAPGSFEYEWSCKWKQQYEYEQEQLELLKKQQMDGRDKLDCEMESAAGERQAMLMRQDLMRRQEELRRLEENRRDMERRRQEEFKMREEQRRREMAAKQEDMMRRRDSDLRMQQESLMRRRPDDMVLQRDQALQQDDMKRQMFLQQEALRNMGGGGSVGGNNSGGSASGAGGGGNSSGGPQSLMGSQRGLNNSGSPASLMSVQSPLGGPRQSRFDQPPRQGPSPLVSRSGPSGPMGGGNNGPRGGIDDMQGRRSFDRMDMDRRGPMDRQDDFASKRMRHY
ncbi:uncharacterized protein LOC100371475 isoform X2 [Saccoglossus kowalevskii]|uniref:Splicing factor, proline- and glutamine-rich-like isoform X2 n=1 Tax=Saccoglossus kowalevskii TaxID=10224 RepID=A0ABM0MKH9_SACKO|nr:PREDICTED: splicing factor, proline- and glutamine-rich-like isoform X2 [Saccoglossus kowalevskii]